MLVTNTKLMQGIDRDTVPATELAPVVIEAAGTESALATAVNLAAKGLVGIPSTYWNPTEFLACLWE